MKRTKKMVELISVLVALSACSGNSNPLVQSDLPNAPNEIIFEWSDGGGMLPEGENIYISEDSSYYSFWHVDIDQKIYFNSSKSEMDSLYSIFKNEKFDQIELIEEGEVYDRGGTSIRLIADGKYFDKNNSGMTFVNKSWQKTYDDLSSALYSFALKKIENQKVKVTVGFDKKILEENLKLYISINGNSIFNTDNDSNAFYRDTLIYQAAHVFEATVYDKDSLNSYGSPAFLETVFLQCDNINQSDTIYFYWSENQVKVKSF